MMQIGSLKMKIRFAVNRKNLMDSLILIPFLYPRGFVEYSYFYKLFFTLWLYIAVLCIAIFVLDKIIRARISFNKFFGAILLYYVAMFVITLLVRRTFLDGLQKIFAAPMLAIFTYIELKTRPINFIKSVNRILTWSFIVGLTVFNPIFWTNMFNPEKNHLFFWGHVQVGAQLGLMFIIFSYVEYLLLPKYGEKKLFFRMALAVCVMLISATSLSYLVIIILLVYTLLYERIQLKEKEEKIVTLYLTCNLLLFFSITKLGPVLNIGNLSLNGRGFIWEKALENFLRSPLVGYGVHGTLIQVFWSRWSGDGTGMNYMHNQLLQVANDGGLLLLTLYIIILYTEMESIDKISSKKVRKKCGGFMLAVLVIMSFESGLEYIYLLMVLILLGKMKNLTVRKKSCYVRNVIENT